MRTYFLNFIQPIAFVLLVSTLLFTSCKDDDVVVAPPSPVASETSNTVIAVPFFVQNENQEMPNNPDDVLYEVRKNNPLLAPDGHQVTWGEFASVQGNIEVECMDNQTKISLNVKGLIPYGQYTIWNVTFDAPGIDPSHPMLGLEGLGAAGKGDGSDNSFVANAMGEGSITLTSPGGPLSMIGSIGNCALLDNYEWHVVGAYHIDGRVYGGDLGPDGTVAEHFGFIFKNDD